MQALTRFTVRHCYGLGLLFRLLLLAFAAWQDVSLPIRYTDVDYDVFMGAAALAARGGSPYEQPGYRYPPMIAWLLLPGAWLGIPWLWGRLLFVLFDFLCAQGIGSLALLGGAPAATARACQALFLLSPFSAVLSTRGSMDSLACFATLQTLIFATLLAASAGAKLGWRSAALGVALGAAVHLRLYPVIYTAPCALLLGNNIRSALIFLLSAGCTFVALTGASVAAHGWDAVGQAYLYHGSRVDAAHSFSPLWVHIHASLEAGGGGGWAVAAPWSLLAALALGAALWRDPPLCFFLQTLAFVSLNRVVTAQYFNWWGVFLPVLAPRCTLSARAMVALGGAWLLAYLHWLAWAYQLEHAGRPVHWQLGTAAWLFFSANAALGGSAWLYRRDATAEERRAAAQYAELSFSLFKEHEAPGGGSGGGRNREFAAFSRAVAARREKQH